MEDEANNTVHQSNNTIANGDIAGRDIYKNTYSQLGTIINVFFSEPQNHLNNLAILSQLTALPEEIISILLRKDGQIIHTYESLDKCLSLLSISKDLLLSDSVSDIKKEYERIVLGDYKPDLHQALLKQIFKTAAVHIKNHEFDKAHDLFAKALTTTSPIDETYNLIYREYLITGFIQFSKVNNMDGLRSLLKRKRLSSNSNSSVDYIIANIFQEVCSRDTEIESLQKSLVMLEKILRSAPNSTKSIMANSLGLAYRRVGERTDFKYLEQAVETLQSGLELATENTPLEVQLKDNLATVYIRMFESTLNETYLLKAENILYGCLDKFKTILDPRDYVIKPRVLNTMGNIFKQRVLIYGDFTSASKAIGYYEEAEKIWTEKESSYEWGLLKKNIGETKYALGNITGDAPLLVEGLTDCLSAMKYRDLENSPYQWAKSVEIIIGIVIALEKKKALSTLSNEIQKIILDYINIVNDNSGKWNPNNFENFYTKASLAERILANK